MFKAADKWLLPYLNRSLKRKLNTSPTETHVMLAICDHYEPLSPHAAQSIETGKARVARWLKEWPEVSQAHVDSDGRHPKHSIFYPAEEAEKPEVFIPLIKPLVDDGFAEIEVHLHHADDTADSLRKQLVDFRDYLGSLNLLGKDADGKDRYAFIHGNWALCNSRPDGKHCGVDEEIKVLVETGCYADLTFPSIPSPTQPKKFCNSIYYAKDIPGGPRSHEHGHHAAVGTQPSKDELMMIQGPVGLNWKWRKAGIIPRIEHADICATNPPTPLRADLWIHEGIHVKGRPEWIFIKLHTHGCLEKNMPALLEGSLCNTYTHLESLAKNNESLHLHYVSAREMYNIAKAAVDGRSGNPNEFRNDSIT